MSRPLIAITCSVDEKDVRVRRAYADAVHRCGGVAVLLPVPSVNDDVDAIARLYVEAFPAFLFTGGDDPRTEAYGEPTHPSAKVVAAERQRFEEALLRALDDRRGTPVLGVCLGMQMMALHAGGKLNQHLPENTPTHAEHAKDNLHRVVPEASAGGTSVSPICLPKSGAKVASWHHQAVRDPGRLSVIARADDGVIEGVHDASRRFYVGVQWHPERTPGDDGAGDGAGDGVIRALVEAARGM
jgi:putative glutamine amidotransferase